MQFAWNFKLSLKSKYWLEFSKTAQDHYARSATQMDILTGKLHLDNYGQEYEH